MKKFLGLLILLFLVTASFLPVALAQEKMVSEWVTQTAMSQAANYWTKERMLNAKPYPMAVSGEPGTSADVESIEAGEPGYDPGSAGGKSVLLKDGVNDTLALTGAFESSEIFAGTVQPTDYSYPPPHTTFNVPTYLYGTTTSYYPYRAVGKVFFTKYGGGNYVCSGSSIGNKAVLTAGHCVSDGAGHFHTNWTFVPAYRNGTRPYGTWTAFWKTTFSVWHTGGNLARDVGFTAVSNVGGKTLAATVGWLGFAYNFSSPLHWNMFGYPAGSPYTGAWLVQTQASRSRLDSTKSPATRGIGTKQTGGCSGGPWIYDFMVGNYANGVNSYVYTAQPLELFSPYFDTSVKSMKDTAVAKN